jgi:hypothetical protein
MTDTLAYIQPVVLNVFTQLICSSASHIVLLLKERVATFPLQHSLDPVRFPGARIDVIGIRSVAAQIG